MVVGCQPYAPTAFAHRKYSWYSFLLEAESTPGPWCDRKDFMSIKNPLTPAGIEPGTFRFVAQHLNHCATAVPQKICNFAQLKNQSSNKLNMKWLTDEDSEFDIETKSASLNNIGASISSQQFYTWCILLLSSPITEWPPKWVLPRGFKSTVSTCTPMSTFLSSQALFYWMSCSNLLY